MPENNRRIGFGNLSAANLQNLAAGRVLLQRLAERREDEELVGIFARQYSVRNVYTPQEMAYFIQVHRLRSEDQTAEEWAQDCTYMQWDRADTELKHWVSERIYSMRYETLTPHQMDNLKEAMTRELGDVQRAAKTCDFYAAVIAQVTSSIHRNIPAPHAEERLTLVRNIANHLRTEGQRLGIALGH